MKAKRSRWKRDPGSAGCRCSAATETLKVQEPPKRSAGKLVRACRNWSKNSGTGEGHLMAILIAEHDNAAIKPALLNTVAAAVKSAVTSTS